MMPRSDILNNCTIRVEQLESLKVDDAKEENPPQSICSSSRGLCYSKDEVHDRSRM